MQASQSAVQQVTLEVTVGPIVAEAEAEAEAEVEVEAVSQSYSMHATFLPHGSYISAQVFRLDITR